MGSDTPNREASSSPSSQEVADIAQAFHDLARGEQTAASLERSLSVLESKLDAMLEAFEAQQQNSGPVLAPEQLVAGGEAAPAVEAAGTPRDKDAAAPGESNHAKAGTKDGTSRDRTE